MPGKLDEWQTINNKLQHCPWLSHQAWLHTKTLHCWEKVAWPPLPLFCTYSSEKENMSFKNYCKGENCLLYLFETFVYWQCTEGKKVSFLTWYLTGTSTGGFSFPSIPDYQQWYLPRLNQAVWCLWKVRYSLLLHPTTASSFPHLKKQLHCTTELMASED